MRKFSVPVGSVVGSAILLMAGSAYAQTTPGDQNLPDGVDAAGASAPIDQAAPVTTGTATVARTDQDIIVTARKRGERLQDVPAAITAVSSAELNRYSTNSVSQISTRVPQLQVGTVSGPGGGSINLRGIGSPGTSPSVDQAVSINIDGIQVSQGNAINLGVYDLDRVEVLKGPQALFYGKNSLGGIISLISADPGTELEWRARAGYELKQQRQVYEGMVSVPLAEGFGARIDGAYADQNGWFLNRLNDVPGSTGVSTSRGTNTSDVFVRGTLKFASSNGAFDASLKASYASSDRDSSLGSQTQIFSCPLGAPQLQVFGGNAGGVGDCKLDRYIVDPQISPGTAAAAPYYLQNGDTFFEQRQFLTSLQMNFRPIDELKLTSVTGYYHFNERWNWNVSAGELESLVTGARVGDEQFTQELRLASSFKSPVNFVVGAFYQNSTKRFDAPLVTTGFLTGFTAPLVLTDDRFRQKTEAYSFFGQGILTLSDQLEATAGGRFSFENKSIRDLRYTSALSGFSPTPVNLAFSPSRVSFNDFSPEITLRYRPTSDLTIYGAYREGFTSGGFNAAPATPAGDITYQQARAHGFEVGFKGNLLDRQLTFDASVYTYKYNDLQLNAFDPVSISVKVRNAASARTKGAELALTFSPRAVEGLTLRSNVAYNHGRYLTYTDASCYAGQSVAQGCNGNLIPRFDPSTGAAIGPSFSTQDLSGTQLERSPDLTMSHGFSYQLPVSTSMTFSFGGDANYTDSFQPEPGHNPRAFQRDAWRYNAFATLASANEAWELSFIGRNLTNKLRAQTAFEYPLTGASYPGYAAAGLGADVAGAPTEPRTLMLQVTLRNALLK
jgi:iron complex outermembrane receptor protein